MITRTLLRRHKGSQRGKDMVSCKQSLITHAATLILHIRGFAAAVYKYTAVILKCQFCFLYLSTIGNLHSAPLRHPQISLYIHLSTSFTTH